MDAPVENVVAALEESAARLDKLSSREEVRWRAAMEPGAWPAHTALAHLRSSDDIFRPRLLQVVVRDEPLLIGLNDELWQATAGYDQLPAARLIRGFVSLREELLHALRGLPVEAWQRTGIHEQRGLLTLLQLAQGMAAHEREHVDQIVAALGVSA